jgi:hypothetical protein
MSARQQLATTLLTSSNARASKSQRRGIDAKSYLRNSNAIGKQLSLLPNVILTCIWHLFNLKGISSDDNDNMTSNAFSV